MHSTPFEVLIMIQYKNVRKLFIIVLKKAITSLHPPCLENHQQRKPAKIGTSQDFKISLETRLMSQQDDFVNQPSMLETLIKDAGHECIFLPKFHCELNPIEMVPFSIKSASFI